jgi:hypothetical protein
MIIILLSMEFTFIDKLALLGLAIGNAHLLNIETIRTELIHVLSTWINLSSLKINIVVYSRLVLLLVLINKG